MKKLLLTLAVVFTAATSQAAAIGWSFDTSGYGSADWGNANPSPFTGYIAYLVTDAQLAQLVNSDGLLDKDKWNTSLTLGNITINKKGVGLTDIDGYNQNDYVKVYTIFFEGSSVVKDTTPYMITDYIDGTFGAIGGVPAAFVWGDNTPTSFGGWSQIPEPATMALVGIGIVAFGLRRRRK